MKISSSSSSSSFSAAKPGKGNLTVWNSLNLSFGRVTFPFYFGPRPLSVFLLATWRISSWQTVIVKLYFFIFYNVQFPIPQLAYIHTLSLTFFLLTLNILFFSISDKRSSRSRDSTNFFCFNLKFYLSPTINFPFLKEYHSIRQTKWDFTSVKNCNNETLFLWEPAVKRISFDSFIDFSTKPLDFSFFNFKISLISLSILTWFIYMLDVY